MTPAPPTLLALVADAFGGRGGIAQYNRDFLSALAETGVVSSITVLPRLAPDPANPPDMITQLRPHRRRSLYSLKALRLALSKPFDIVFCGHLFMASLAWRVAKLRGSKLIVQTHGIEAWPKPSPFRQRALEEADLVLCVSRYTRSAVLKWASIPPERVVVLPNTVRDVFSPGDAGGVRQELGLQSKRILLTVARLSSQEGYKGHDRVIALLPQLIAKGYDIVYIVAGEGHHRPRLEEFALNTVGRDRVLFVGAIELPLLVRLYRACDLFVLPSHGEGFGIVFLEAMACGTPTLGLDIAGSRDALGDGELGTLVSERELADAIESMLQKPRPDSDRLSSAVHTRFGRRQFSAGASAAIQRLSGVNCPGVFRASASDAD